MLVKICYSIENWQNKYLYQFLGATARSMSTAKASQKLGAVPNAPFTKFFEIDLQSCVIGTGLNQACPFNVKAETIFFLLCPSYFFIASAK